MLWDSWDWAADTAVKRNRMAIAAMTVVAVCLFMTWTPPLKKQDPCQLFPARELDGVPDW